MRRTFIPKQTGVSHLFLFLIFWGLHSLILGCSVEERKDTMLQGNVAKVFGSAENAIFGFENFMDWTNASSNSPDHSQGISSVAVTVEGWTTITSPAMSTLGDLGDVVSVDLKMPQKTPYWGEVRIILDIPSMGVWSREVGSRSTMGLAADVFNTFDFTIPSDVVPLFAEAYNDLTFTVVINAPTGTYLVDNMKFDNSSFGDTDDTDSDSDSSASGCEDSEQQIVINWPSFAQLGEIALGASDELTLAQRIKIEATTSTVPVLSNLESTQGLTYIGTDCVTQHIYSFNSVELRDRVSVNGNIKTTVPIIRHNDVATNGTVEESVDFGTANEFEWTVSVPCTVAGGVHLEPDTEDAIEPGRYSEITVKSRSTLTLSAGMYFVDKLDVEPQAIIQLDSESPVIFIVSGSIIYRGSIIGLGGNNSIPFIVYTGTEPVFVEAAYTGNIIAPNARLVLGTSGATHTGAFIAKNINVYPDVTINHVPLELDIDFDNDGLSFSEEVNVYGTDPFKADSDEDGLNDGDEVAYWTSRTDGISWDSDIERRNALTSGGDGLVNLLDPDSDDDGLLDGLEVNGWNINVNGTLMAVNSDPTRKDSDSDGLTDLQEYKGWEISLDGLVEVVKSHPGAIDIDNDTIPDNLEHLYLSSPLTPYTYGDTLLDIRRLNYIALSGDFDPSGDNCPAVNGRLEDSYMLNFSATPNTTVSNSTYRIGMTIFLSEEMENQNLTLSVQSLNSSTPDSNDSFDNFEITFPGEKNPDIYSESGNGELDVVFSSSSKGQLEIEFDYLFDGNGSTLNVVVTDTNGEEVPIQNFFMHSDDTNSMEFQIFSKFYTSGDSLFLKGGAYSKKLSSDTSPNSFIDRIKIDGMTIHRRAFNRGPHSYPLFSAGSSLTEGEYNLSYIWNHSAAPAELAIHLCEDGEEWDDVQITYDGNSRTKDYETWASGVADGRAIVRQASDFYVVVTHNSLGSYDSIVDVIQGTISDDDIFYTSFPVGPGTVQISKIHEVSDAVFPGTFREIYKVHVRNWAENGGLVLGAETGFYRVEATSQLNAEHIGESDFGIIFNPFVYEDKAHGYPGGLSHEELEAYAYDEYEGFGDVDRNVDGRSIFFQFNENLTNMNYLINNYWDLNITTEQVAELSLAAIHKSPNPFTGAGTIARFSNAYIEWYELTITIWDSFNAFAPSIGELFYSERPVLEDVWNGNYAVPLAGQCMDFAGVSNAMYRSAGLPARIASGNPLVPKIVATRGTDNSYDPSNIPWTFHVWNEVFVAMNTDMGNAGEGFWVVEDSTDSIGSPTGYPVNFPNWYGDEWEPEVVWVENTDKTLDPSYLDVTSEYLNP